MIVFKRLLYLKMTPNIQYVYEQSLHPKIYTILLNVIQTSQVEYKKLESIPVSFQFYRTYAASCYALKNILESTEIVYERNNVLPMDFLHGLLYKFKRWRLIRLTKTNFSSLIDLNGVLDGLHHLGDIILNFGFAGDSLATDNKSNMNIWLKRRATKVEHLKKIEMIYYSGNKPTCNLVEYATYK